jgi:hypothetical protein
MKVTGGCAWALLIMTTVGQPRAVAVIKLLVCTEQTQPTQPRPSALLFTGGTPAIRQQAAQPTQPKSVGCHELQHASPGVLATIIRSPSTNTRGYKLVIHDDGSNTAEIGGVRFANHTEPPPMQQFAPATVATKSLRRLFTQIGDVSKIPCGVCVKSASFGTRTQISYAGKTSGDLQCIRQQTSGSDQKLLEASEELSRLVGTILGQLKIDDRRLGSAH